MISSLRRLTFFSSLACLVALSPALVPAAGAEDRITAQGGRAEQPLPRGLAGRVLGESDPLATARVYAYKLADEALFKGATDADGRFAFAELPVGLYKLVTYKAGFVPAVILLTRATADAYQFVEVQLQRERLDAAATASGFWLVRAEIPPDVLREITVAEAEAALKATDGRSALDDGRRFHGRMEAMTGIDQIAAHHEGQLTGGRVGLEGRVGGFSIGVKGDYRALDPRDFTAAGTAAGPEAQASAVSVDLAGGRDTHVTVSSASNRWDLLDGDAPAPAAVPVNYEHYRVSVSQGLGERASSYFAAQYTSESNFHRHGWIDPAGIPEASRRWRLEGGYSAALGERTTVEAGLRYREQQAELAAAEPAGERFFITPVEERVDMFGRGGTQVQPALLVEYGLYSTLRDGSLSLAPRGGLVLQLGSSWQAATTVSHEVHDDADHDLHDFAPQLFRADGDCDLGEEQCYKLLFSHRGEEDEEVVFGAVHRKIGDTARLYFSEDAFDRLESLYLVPGDRLPELRFAMSRRLAPRVLTRLESNLASGGGGVFFASDLRSYENQIRYLVTSLDTHFQGTSTGVFIAFHHLEQALAPLAEPSGAPPQLFEVERLQLRLTQDLDFLLNLATDWAIRFNMELSRGSNPLDPFGDDNDEVRKRFLGGIAVRF